LDDVARFSTHFFRDLEVLVLGSSRVRHFQAKKKRAGEY